MGAKVAAQDRLRYAVMYSLPGYQARLPRGAFRPRARGRREQSRVSREDNPGKAVPGVPRPQEAYHLHGGGPCPALLESGIPPDPQSQHMPCAVQLHSKQQHSKSLLDWCHKN